MNLLHSSLKWIAEAAKLIGVAEIKGPQHNAAILQVWKDAKLGGIKDDETPWCAGFVSAMLERAGIRSGRTASSLAYLKWGQTLVQPIMGCIVVFKREGGGHVGFCVGKTADGKLLILGGNQADAVNVKAFGLERVVGYRWPEGVAVTIAGDLPIVNEKVEVSQREA